MLDFIIPGQQRCGTTAVKDMLNSHEQICVLKGTNKHSSEVHCFDKLDGVDYKKFYKELIEEQDVGSDVFFGDKSPSYLRSINSMTRIKKSFPYIKLIILLRCPVDRWYSNLNHQNILNKRMSAEDNKERGKVESQSFWNNNIMSKTRGMYATQITLVLDMFPAKNVMIVGNESLKENTEVIMKDMVNFIGADSSLPMDVVQVDRKRHNKDTSIHKEIKEYYYKSNQSLRAVLDRHDYDSELIMKNWL